MLNINRQEKRKLDHQSYIHMMVGKILAIKSEKVKEKLKEAERILYFREIKWL